MATVLELDTPYGWIQVLPQSDRDLYLPGSDLDFGSFRVRVSGHLSRTESEPVWAPYRGTWQIKRTDSPRDTTTRMDVKVREAVLEAVAAIDELTLAGVQAAKRLEQAREREDLAAKLLHLSNRLIIEADALRMGGREEYHDHDHGNGFHETGVRHVRTRDGVLLPSLPEVKVYASHKYGPRLP